MQIQLNNQFEINGMPGYNIDTVIHTNNIMPYNQKQNFDQEMKDCSGATQLDKSKSGNKSSNQSTISTEFASSNGVSGMADTSSGDSGSANRTKEDKSNFTQIMLNRWNQANRISIP